MASGALYSLGEFRDVLELCNLDAKLKTNMARIWNKHKQTNTPLKRKVFVAMSGGVDSSVAAFLLKEKGYDVTGAHMICWDGCDGKDDRRDAVQVAQKIGIPFLTFDFRKEYRERVFNYMIREYAAGRTPNPDVICNSEIKFGIFLEKALEMGADYIATGHYARTDDLGIKIYESKDKSKDQSYFLCRLTKEQISRAIFPVGDLLKSEVREIARKASLQTAEKKDSQGLCFIGKLDFQDFLRGEIACHEGQVINSRGEILGKHDGIEFFTPGQRHGIKLGGFKKPLYVAEKKPETNTLIVAEGDKDPILYKKEIEVSDMNWISEKPEFPFICDVRIRYRQAPQSASLYKLQTNNYKLITDLPQRGAASGQFAALYNDEILLGGGVIQ